MLSKPKHPSLDLVLSPIHFTRKAGSIVAVGQSNSVGESECGVHTIQLCSFTADVSGEDVRGEDFALRGWLRLPIAVIDLRLRVF